MNDLFLLLVGAIIGVAIGLAMRGSPDNSETLDYLERMRQADDNRWRWTAEDLDRVKNTLENGLTDEEFLARMEGDQ